MGNDGSDVKQDGFDVATPNLLSRTLARKLVPAVDRIRNLFTKLGARPYRISLVRTRWTGGERGEGIEDVVSATDIVPTPKVIDLGTLAEIVTPVGPTEIGLIQLQQVSGRYTEEFLTGVDPDGRRPGASDSLYYEITFFRGDGRGADKHRFALAQVPMYHATKFQWTITLDAQIAKRRRDGRPRP